MVPHKTQHISENYSVSREEYKGLPAVVYFAKIPPVYDALRLPTGVTVEVQQNNRDR
jgi:hypothetical protein